MQARLWAVATIITLCVIYLLTPRNYMDTNKEETIKAYFQGLQAGSYEQVIRLFDKDAIVHSPLYGEIRADKFYRELFAATSSSTITLKNIFLSSNDPHSAAAH